jgi:hypothetical protein
MIVDNKWMLWMQVCWEESESITFQGVTPFEETEQAAATPIPAARPPSILRLDRPLPPGCSFGVAALSVPDSVIGASSCRFAVDHMQCT